MKKPLLIFTLMGMMLFSMPAVALAGSPVAPGIEQMDEDVTVSIDGQTVTISGGQGQTLEVVSLTGRRVMTVKIDSPAQRIELNIPKGCYILKIGKVVRKVSVH